MNVFPPPRVAAIHDLSCVGRCALTVVMPTLSVMGCQVIPLPTALLSSHTGGFDDLYFRDLTADMGEITAHFSRLRMTFRSVYTGFLGSAEQIRTVSAFLDRFASLPDESGEKPLIFVDPVMGDDGVLYSTYTRELVDGIRTLCYRAHVMTPNLTEACLLTDTPYRNTALLSEKDAETYVAELSEKLRAYGAERTVITGIVLCSGRIANYGSEKGKTFCVSLPARRKSYPGTGDIFASVTLGALLRGTAFPDAVAEAAEFVATLIGASENIPTEERYGVALEPYLRLLTKKD